MTDQPQPKVELDFSDLDGTQLEIFAGGFREMLGPSREHYITIGVMHYATASFPVGESEQPVAGIIWIVGAGSETTDLGDVLPLAICRSEEMAITVVDRVAKALHASGVAGTLEVKPSQSHIDLENPGIFLTRAEIMQAVMARCGPPEKTHSIAEALMKLEDPELAAEIAKLIGTAFAEYAEAAAAATIDIVAMVQEAL